MGQGIVRNLAAGQVSIERIHCPAHILRLHGGGHGHGSAWGLACVIEVKGARAHIKALSRGDRFTAAMRRAIRDALIEIGITGATWTRNVEGKTRNKSAQA